jgi:hypothetical protein
LYLKQFGHTLYAFLRAFAFVPEGVVQSSAKLRYHDVQELDGAPSASPVGGHCNCASRRDSLRRDATLSLRCDAATLDLNQFMRTDESGKV